MDENRLCLSLDENEVVVLKENKRILGATRFTSIWEREFFPVSHSYAKASEILDDFPYRGESVVYLDFLFVDPSFRGNGRGKRMWEYCFHRYEKASFLVLLKENDPKDFFIKQGFVPLYRDYGVENMGGVTLYVKPYTKTGICSDPSF